MAGADKARSRLGDAGGRHGQRFSVYSRDLF
jgi:hypothetical protein